MYTEKKMPNYVACFFVSIPNCFKNVYVNSFFPRTARFWNSLPSECFSLADELKWFRINRHLT